MLHKGQVLPFYVITGKSVSNKYYRTSFLEVLSESLGAVSHLGCTLDYSWGSDRYRLMLDMAIKSESIGCDPSIVIFPL